MHRAPPSHDILRRSDRDPDSSVGGNGGDGVRGVAPESAVCGCGAEDLCDYERYVWVLILVS